MRILVIGGTGFIGRHVIARLSVDEHQILIPTRYYGRARDLQIYPTVTLIEANVYDNAVLDYLVQGCDAVINLAGILHEGRGQPYGAGFCRVHVQLPKRIAQACRRHGVRRVLHISALGANPDGPSMYLRSKGDGEDAICDALANWSEGSWTIFRPSVVFGPGDKFTRQFARLATYFPVLPVASAHSRLQPVYVNDVVAVMRAALASSLAANRIYELCGPQVYTLGELVSLCARYSGHPRRVYAVPKFLGRLQAHFFECLLSQPLLSRDNLDSLCIDNVCNPALAPDCGIVFSEFATVVPTYLKEGSS
jgi:uncharacterized protein YbjT (DUF2867 family)